MATAREQLPIRILTAVPLCDGHDSAISTINLELIRHGIEVIYLGYHRSVRDVVRAAVQEDVRGVGLSSYNGGHVEFFTAVAAGLRRQGAGHITVFGGGGGTITAADATKMRRGGVDRIFFPGESLDDIVDYVERACGSRRRRTPAVNGRHAQSQDMKISVALRNYRAARSVAGGRPRVIGVSGPGGAGKTTLIDELVLRLLRRDAGCRIAVLSHDPTLVSGGALLGDRATMVYSQDDRVFMRSLGSRGQAGGLSPATIASLAALRTVHRRANVPPFDWIFVETVGAGQEALPFPRGMVDRSVLVMSPEYGARLQLQKIAMLDTADVVAINKSDLAQARTAQSELGRRMQQPAGDPAMGERILVATVAKRHGDPGVDRLLEALGGDAGVTTASRRTLGKAVAR